MSETNPLSIAYLMNSYPMTSTTFIRREIEALETLGTPVQRFAVREWAGKLVDQRDIDEQSRTVYLLTNNVARLFAALPLAVISNPMGVARALALWVKLVRNAGGEIVRHVAYLLQAAHFYRLAKARRIDHIHVHFATNAATVAMLARQMGGPSYSFTVHGPDELLIPEKLSFTLKIEHAAFVVAISDFCRNFLLRYASAQSRDKILIARCGIALEEFPDDDANERANKTFVCVGRLCDQKGQILIPKAAAQLRKDYPDLRIILIGDGEIRGDIERQRSDYDVADIVELKGWMENRAVLKLVRSSRALLLPSYAEGLPVVIMEALALGTPVISTTIAGIPELVDDECGWLFAPGDEAGLVNTMRSALECSPDTIRRMSQAGRRRVTRMHDRRVLASILRDNFRRAVSA